MTDIPANFVDWSPAGLLALVVLLVITDKLVWHKRLAKEEERTAKAEALADKAVSLVEKVSGQVADLTAATEKNAKTDDMAVALLRSMRRALGPHLGVKFEEDDEP